MTNCSVLYDLEDLAKKRGNPIDDQIDKAEIGDQIGVNWLFL
jgi:hypothetical protein